MRPLQRLRSVDFYRKIPSDLTEATLSGASISILAAITIIFLLGAEFSAFMQPETKSDMIVDRSAHGELLRVNFNVSFPALSCEFATLDVSDTLGLKRLNLTKTVRKLPVSGALERKGRYMEDKAHPEPKYDEEHAGAQYEDVNIADSLSDSNFDNTLHRYDAVVVNYYAPWCPWCQRLGPTWEAATEEIHNKYPESDGRIRFAKVDCTAEVMLCRKQFITAFPMIRVYRHGSDDIETDGHHEHESYHGDRTKEALIAFADSLAAAAGQPHSKVESVTKSAKTSGCNFSGFVLVKKVPGTLHFVPRAPGHTFDTHTLNMSHYVHYFYFGNKPSPKRRNALAELHPLGLADDWMDKLRDRAFFSPGVGSTYEHYLQVVLTSIEPQSRPDARFDAYEYTAQSHVYISDHDETPAAKFTYDQSPIQIVVTEKPKAWYHFLTAVCAVVGGVFTVAGIIDGIVHHTAGMAKKIDLGKQG